MGQRLRAIRRNDSGFTLTELLIVIVILGVLAGIVLFAVGSFTGRGETAACKAAMKTTEVAVETYKANNSGNPPGTLQVLVDGGYLKELPSNSSTKYTISYDAGAGVVSGYVADTTKTDGSG